MRLVRGAPSEFHSGTGFAAGLQAGVAAVQQALVHAGPACAAALFLPDGRLAALPRGAALRHGSLVPAVQGMLAEFPVATMAPGDGFLSNDPWRGGTQLADFVLLRPLFAQGAVQALLACSLQHEDVGALVEGLTSRTAISIHDEGLRIPPVRLFGAGLSDPALFRLLVTNSRTPDRMAAGLRAQWSALQAGEQELQASLQDAGTFQANCEHGIAASDAATRAVLHAAPDGDYRLLDALEAEGTPPLRLVILLRKRGDTLVVDLTGCAAQSASPLNASRAAVWGALTQFALGLVPEAAGNAGSTASLQLKTSPGTVVDPAFPAAVGGGAQLAQLLAEGLQSAWSRL